MALNVKGKKAEPENLNITSVEVSRAVNNDYGVFFDLVLNGITIKNCKLMQRNDDQKYFISWPSQKGKDEKYYSLVYARIADCDMDAIVHLIEKKVGGANG